MTDIRKGVEMKYEKVNWKMHNHILRGSIGLYFIVIPIVISMEVYFKIWTMPIDLFLINFFFALAVIIAMVCFIHNNLQMLKENKEAGYK